MWSRVLLVLGVATTVACAAQPSNDSGVGSSSADVIDGMQDGAPTDFPEVVQILINDKAQDYCTGTLLSPTRVLTAAHCTGASSFVVKAPNVKPAATSNAKLLGVVAHSKNFLDDVGTEDAAVLELSTPIQLDSYPTLKDVGELGTQTLIGVGVGRSAESRLAPLVKSTAIKISSGTDDGYTTGLKGEYYSSGGDSGGPLFLVTNGVTQHIIIGIERQPDPPNEWFTRITPAVLTLTQQ